MLDNSIPGGNCRQVGMAGMLKEIVAARLAELDRNPFEASRIGGLERSYVNDILIGKKKSIRADKAAGLARALDLPDASELVDVIAASLWEIFTEAALNAAFSKEASLNEASLSDPRIAQGILGEIRKAVSAHSKISKGLANPQTLREVVYYSVLEVLDRLQREIAEEKRLSHRPSPSNHDEKKPRKP
jgi:hypothetical protein